MSKEEIIKQPTGGGLNGQIHTKRRIPMSNNNIEYIFVVAQDI